MFFTPSNRMNMWASCLTPGGRGEKKGLKMQLFRHPTMLTNQDLQERLKFQTTHNTFNLHLNCKHNLKIWTHLTQTCHHLYTSIRLYLQFCWKIKKIKSFKSVVDLFWEAIVLDVKNSQAETVGRIMLASCKNTIIPSKTDEVLQLQDQNLKPKA